jgi:hypothetical protein
MMKTNLFLGITLFTFASGALAQQRSLPQDTLAIVGTDVVTALDLLERIELMPWPDKDKEEGKRRALHALVAEKLLALEGQRLRIGEDPEEQLMLRVLEKAFVRDELYKREILPQVRVTPELITSALKRFSLELTVLAISVPSREEGERVAGRIAASNRPDSLLDAIVSAREYWQEVVKVRWGDLEPEFEEGAYVSNETGRAQVVRSHRAGWLVLHALDAYASPEHSSLSLSEQRQRVENVLKQRQEIEHLRKYYGHILGPQMAEVDPVLFERVAAYMRNLILQDTAGHRRKDVYTILPEDVDMAVRGLRSDLQRPFVQIGEHVVPLGEILEEFRYQLFAYSTLEEERFKDQFNASIRKTVEAALMAREGRRQNLHHSASVRRDLAVWSDHRLARILYEQLKDSVSVADEEIMRFLIGSAETLGRLYEVQVSEIPVASREEAHNAITRLADAPSGGSAYFRIVDRPEIGFAALLARGGDILGPIETPTGMSVIRVEDWRKVHPEVMDVDTLLQRTRTHLQLQKRSALINNYVAGLARDHNVRLMYDRLAAVRTTKTAMITRRLLGFGGVMKAIPMLLPLWDWVREYERPGTVMP